MIDRNEPEISPRLIVREAVRAAMRKTAGIADEAHLGADDFAGYASECLAPLDELRVVTHLDKCDLCSQEMDSFLSVSGDWDSADSDEHFARLSSKLVEEFRLGVAEELSTPRALVPGLPTSVLEEYGVVQKDYDYVLPCGLHSDTHVDPTAICSSEPLLKLVTHALRSTLPDLLQYNSVVSAGWVMATIAQRLLRDLPIDRPRIPHVRLNGYRDEIPLEVLPERGRSLLLLDVVASGAQMTRLASQLALKGAVTIRSLVIESSRSEKTPGSFQALWAIPMELSKMVPPSCIGKERREYNPLACRLTQKKQVPLDVSRFLNDNQSAVEFWDLVDAARAYEHHHVEGDRHYTAYVDTQRLVDCPLTQAVVLKKYLKQVWAHMRSRPDVLLVRNRRAAVTFARLLQQRMGDEAGAVTLLVLRQDRGRFVLSDSDRLILNGGTVLIVDTAAAHGDTIDALSDISSNAGAVRVTAGVVLSRLGESRELAIHQRLSGGFFCSYAVPIPPFEIHQTKNTCGVCAEKDTMSRAALAIGSERLEAWATQIQQRRKRGNPPMQVQSSLEIDDRPLLERCRKGVVAGATLHALHASMGNGMAPLSIPEIRNPRMSPVNRAAMLDALPGLALCSWASESLLLDLTRELRYVDNAQLWTSIADFLARAGSSAWINEIESMLDHARPEGAECIGVWNRLALAAFRAAESRPAASATLCDRLREIRDGRSETSERLGLGTIVDAVVAGVACQMQ